MPGQQTFSVWSTWRSTKPAETAKLTMMTQMVHVASREQRRLWVCSIFLMRG